MTIVLNKSLVLLVDDDEVYRQYIEVLLRSYSHELIEACDGAEGLLKYKQCRPTLIITDIQMPEVDGYQFISAVRDLDQQTPIVAMSSEKHLLEKALDCGATKIMDKSFPKSNFDICMQQYLTA